MKWGSARDLVTIATDKGTGRNLQKYMRCYRLGREREEERANKVRMITVGGRALSGQDNVPHPIRNRALVTISQSGGWQKTKHLPCTRRRTIVKHDTRRTKLHWMIQKHQCLQKHA